MADRKRVWVDLTPDISISKIVHEPGAVVEPVVTGWTGSEVAGRTILLGQQTSILMHNNEQLEFAVYKKRKYIPYV